MLGPAAYSDVCTFSLRESNNLHMETDTCHLNKQSTIFKWFMIKQIPC